MTGIKYTSVTVSDYDKGLKFFVDGLGWDVVEDNSYGDGRWVVVRPKGSPTELVLKRPHDQGATTRLGEFTGIALSTSDLGATYRELRARGVDFPQPPRDMPWGERGAIIADGDGNTYALG